MADEDPAVLIDAKIASLGDWRGATLAALRALIRGAVEANLAKPARS